MEYLQPNRQPTPEELAQFHGSSTWGPRNIPSPGANPYAGAAPAAPNFMDILRLLREQMAVKQQTQQMSQAARDLQAAAQPNVIPPPTAIPYTTTRPAGTGLHPPPTYDTPSQYYGSFEAAPYAAINAAIKAAHSYGR